MGKFRQVQSLGLVNYHRFVDEQTGEFVRVECSGEDYAALGRKGAGPPAPPRKGLKWVDSYGGADKLAPGRYWANVGEMYVRDGKYYVRLHEDDTRPLILDPTKPEDLATWQRIDNE